MLRSHLASNNSKQSNLHVSQCDFEPQVPGLILSSSSHSYRSFGVDGVWAFDRLLDKYCHRSINIADIFCHRHAFKIMHPKGSMTQSSISASLKRA